MKRGLKVPRILSLFFYDGKLNEKRIESPLDVYVQLYDVADAQ